MRTLDSMNFTKNHAFSYLKESLFNLKDHKKSDHGLGLIGAEVECLFMIPGESSEEKPAAVSLAKQKNGVVEILSQFSKKKGFPFQESMSGIPWIDKGALTFEPGGQIEYSSDPLENPINLESSLMMAQRELSLAMEFFGAIPVYMGMNPWHSIHEVGLQIMKPRYLSMTEYFQRFSPIGLEMMRRSCSLQVCLDFGPSQEVAAKRYLAAQWMAPIAGSIFANSPFDEARVLGVRSYRTRVWRNLDPKRSGFPGLNSLIQNLLEGQTFEKIWEIAIDHYFDFAWTAPVVFVEKLDHAVPKDLLLFSDWATKGYKGIFPTKDDWITHLTLLFPEVRPKGFLELRSVDVLPNQWQMAPILFYAALLYDSVNLDKVVSLIADVSKSQPQDHFVNTSMYGLQNEALSFAAIKLMKLALEALDRWPSTYCSNESKLGLQTFARHFTFQKRTPADDWLDLVDGPFKLDMYKKQIAMWQRLLE